MKLDFRSDVPIFIQIAGQLEDEIFTGIYVEETQIPSTTDISVNFRINPATVLKGMNLLVDEGIIYKRRGLGMFVAKGAGQKIKTKRKNEFTKSFIPNLVSEAIKLGLSKEDLISIIEGSFNK